MAKVLLTDNGFRNATIYDDQDGYWLKVTRDEPIEEELLGKATKVAASAGRRSPPVRSLSDLEYFAGLRKLTIEVACVDDYSPLRNLKHLTRVNFEVTNFSDTSVLTGLENLEYCMLPWNFIEDLEPFLSLPNLKSLTVWGNPLTPESYYEVLPELGERVSVSYDDEETWKLQRQMWEAGHRAIYGLKTKSPIKRRHLIVPQLCCRLREKVRIEITPEKLREELSREDANIEEIADRLRPRWYKREDFTEKGDAAQAESWLKEAAISDEDKERLAAFVERFEEVTFVREKKPVFEEMSKKMYYWKDFPRPAGGRPGVPDWFCSLKEALSFVQIDGEDGLLIVDGDEVPDELKGKPVTLRPTGVADAARMALIDRWHFFPVAYVGEKANLALGIRLGEELEDHGVYVADMDRAYQWEFDPFEKKAFEHYTELFSAVQNVVAASTVGGVISELGEEPPALVPHFQLDDHRFVVGADEMKAHIASREIEAPLKASMLRLINEFPEAHFVYEDDEYIEYWEVRNQTRFPRWYRELRKTMSGLIVPETLPYQNRVKLVSMADEVSLYPPGVAQLERRHRMIDKARALPIGHSPYQVLVIRLDSDDRAIYGFDPTVFSADEDYTPFSSCYFTGPAEFFDAIKAVRSTATDEKLARRSG